jgi:hypothetical protein
MTEKAAAERLEKRMRDTFGVSHGEWKAAKAVGPIARAYLTTAARIVDQSGVVPKLLEWDRDARKSNAGRKSYIPLRALLILFLVHVQCGLGVNYKSIAETLDIRFVGLEECLLLDITPAPGDHDDWYQRMWRTVKRLITLLDPYPAEHDRCLGPAQYAAWDVRRKLGANAELSARNQQRLDWVCEQLLHASVRTLPKDILSRAKGNIAIDATLVEIAGKPNSTSWEYPRANPDPFSGRYRREGNHDGQGAKTDLPGYELETAVLVWNKPGERDLFPPLVTAVTMHQPGRLIGHGDRLELSHERLGFNGYLVMADRAYNNEKPENFQLPGRKRGIEYVFDYKSTDLGLQSEHEDLILVDGTWYVTWMPQDLIDASREYMASDEDLAKGRVKQRIDRASYESKLKSRERYQLKAHGRPDSDGYQRFTYPKPGYLAVDRATGELVKPKAPSSITIPLDAGLSKDSKKKNQVMAVKHLQKFAFNGATHRAHKGMRSLVEASNNHLKSKNFEDLGNPDKRSGRGYAFHYLASTLMAVSSNLRRIVAFFVDEATQVHDGPLPRERRRKEATGQRLEKLLEAVLPPPPQ